MIRYLVKNNFKLMLRSGTNILLFIITPLILIAVLSSSFKDLMAHYEEDTGIEVGYEIKGDSMTEELMDSIKESADKEEFNLKEYRDADPKEALKKDDLDAFIVFEDGSYTVYRSDENKEKGKIAEYTIGKIYDRMATSMLPGEPETELLTIENPDFMPAIDSADYYGIIEIVYFGWCAIICGAGLFASEKKNKITRKFKVSNLSETQIYLSKYIPIVLVVFLGTNLAALISIPLFGVHWGNMAVSMVVITFSVAAATALGLMVYSIFENMAATVVVVFMLVWWCGFFGGSFETYMFAAHAESVKRLSPIYHANRALVELSCIGKSDFISSSILFDIAIILVCSFIGIMAGAIRRRGGKA
ncbi:ABC-2 type transport system permease protein [Lachnospiraceae bacterium G11]|nr:ABC-2 type transport system permease protein [Lachnospiraceae bacterium G11]